MGHHFTESFPRLYAPIGKDPFDIVIVQLILEKSFPVLAISDEFTYGAGLLKKFLIENGLESLEIPSYGCPQIMVPSLDGESYNVVGMDQGYVFPKEKHIRFNNVGDESRDYSALKLNFSHLEEIFSHLDWTKEIKRT